jgi:hypothetical protein
MIEPETALNILTACNGHRDFHAMTSDEVARLLSYADKYRYRKPRHANGSRGRAFHAYLTRQADRA